ncbi:MAG: tetratricopeptide repeat protein [Ferruginibacter sp.]|nr:tetratricopeptide repeat protein [Ferruginibacter sp.]
MKHLLFTIPLWVGTAVHAQPDSAQFYFKIGLTEKTNKRYLVASNAFEKAIKFNPYYKEALLESGLNYLEMRKTDFAKTNFTRLYELDPTNKIAVKELTTLYFNYRQFDKAIEFAQKYPDSENSQRIIGMCYYRQEDYPKAENFLKAAVSKNPADAEATYTLARTYLDMEEYKKAVPWYEKSIKLDGAKNTWMYELGLLYYSISDYKNAIAQFQNAAANGYQQSNDFNENMGFAALYTGDYEKGEKLLLAVLAKNPGNKDMLRDIAEVLYKQKQYDKSLAYCQRLMEIDMKDGKALYQAGLNFQRKGEKDRGQQMCDKAIELDPSLDALRRKKEMTGL